VDEVCNRFLLSSIRNRKTQEFFYLETVKSNTYVPSDGAIEFRSGIKIRFGLALVEV
jgi:hypothetical protein